MKLQDIKPLHQGSHTTLYDMVYLNKASRKKHYNIISHNKALTINTINTKQPVNGIVMCAVTEDNRHMLILDEFRMSVNQNVINLPSGLIEAGESPEEATARELLEETGHAVVRFEGTLPETYSAIGITDEQVSVAICRVTNQPVQPPKPSDNELIAAKLVNATELEYMLETQPFTSRTQLLALMWCGNLL